MSVAENHTVGFRTIPRSSGSSPAAKRIIEAGMAFARSHRDEEALEAEVVALQEKADRERLRAKYDEMLERKVGLVQRALNSGEPNPWEKYRELDTRSVPLPSIIAQIKGDACALFGIDQKTLISRRKSKLISAARFYAAQRIMDETPMSTTQCGRTLGGRDHTTIMHACSSASRQRVADYLVNMGTK